jgi:DNA primase
MYSDLKPKYLAYPEGAKIPFYPAVQVNGVTVLVEGIFDVANLLDKGLPNAT